MNAPWVAIVDTETAAGAGLNARRKRHAAGDIPLYATAVPPLPAWRCRKRSAC